MDTMIKPCSEKQASKVTGNDAQSPHWKMEDLAFEMGIRIDRELYQSGEAYFEALTAVVVRGLEAGQLKCIPR